MLLNELRSGSLQSRLSREDLTKECSVVDNGQTAEVTIYEDVGDGYTIHIKTLWNTNTAIVQLKPSYHCIFLLFKCFYFRMN